MHLLLTVIHRIQKPIKFILLYFPLHHYKSIFHPHARVDYNKHHLKNEVLADMTLGRTMLLLLLYFPDAGSGIVDPKHIIERTRNMPIFNNLKVIETIKVPKNGYFCPGEDFILFCNYMLSVFKCPFSMWCGLLLMNAICNQGQMFYCFWSFLKSSRKSELLVLLCEKNIKDLAER